MATTTLANYQIAPSSTTGYLSLPLTFLDIHWFPFHPIQRLLFYEFPNSKSYFLETLIPKLKSSLSTTLRHYTPLAGNLICPIESTGKPTSRYAAGDSVSFTVAESGADFDRLVGDQFRDADEFYAFVPQLPPVIEEPGSRIVPVLALQVTLFPNRGICIGFTNHHVIGDASTIINFVKSWASIHKSDGKYTDSSPFYDRSGIEDPIGIDAIFWSQVQKYITPQPHQSSPTPTNKVRSTFILKNTDTQKLKNLVLSKREHDPAQLHVSSFVVASAYVWSCLAKCNDEDDGDQESDHFAFTVNCRARLNPPLPANYFGNCLGIVVASAPYKEMKYGDGFLSAARAIGESIHREVDSKEEILRGAENWILQFESLFGKRVFGVAGSPKFDLYGVDFGFGSPRKHEAVSIDRDGSMSLCRSKEFEGGLEIGLSMEKVKMEEFEGVFVKGLEDL